MALLRHSDVYWELLGQCTQCGNCTGACSSLTSADMTLGEIARALLSAERKASTREELGALLQENTPLMQALRGCFFCTSCKNTCFAHNDVTKLIYHARVELQELGLIPRENWASVLVDEEWDIFTAYRAVHGIGYSDLTKHLGSEEHAAATDCKVAFFPGCSLASYGSELTREIFSTVENLGGKTTLIEKCCGSSLKSAGFYDRAEALCDRIVEELESSGALELVCVCPGCANDIRTALERKGASIDVRSLPAYLSAHGFKAQRELPESPLCFSKSCQDRDGIYLEETYTVLGADSKSPSVFHGCCGAGGAVSAAEPERQAEQTAKKLSFVPDGSTVVSMCPTCTYTYAYYLMGNPRAIVNKHYTELLFENQFDWEQVFSQLNNMWSGEYGPWLAQVLS